MKKFYTRLLKGIVVILIGIISSVIMTIFCDTIIERFGHADKYIFIFSVGGFIIGIATLIFSIVIWTNNMGDGFKD